MEQLLPLPLFLFGLNFKSVPEPKLSVEKTNPQTGMHSTPSNSRGNSTRAGPSEYTNRRGERRSAESWARRYKRFKEYEARTKRRREAFTLFRNGSHGRLKPNSFIVRGAHRY